jgi:twinkle protein
MSFCVEKLPHSCGTSDALQVFQDDDGLCTGYCYACDTYVPKPYGDEPLAKKQRVSKTPEEIEAELEMIGNLPTLPLENRKLKQESLAWYHVKVAVSEVDGTSPVTSHFPYTRDGRLTAYKNKVIETKQMWATGNLKGDVDLFGWEQALASGSRTLFITEGEEDAIALYQALREKQTGGKWSHLIPAVVSLTRGAAGAKRDITTNQQKIMSNFKDVVLVFDRDDPGRKAEQEVVQIFPTVKTVSIPGKDANECVMEGKSIALANACLFKSNKPKNTRIVVGSSLYEEAKKPIQYGMSYPWEGMTKLTRGMRFGETYYLGSGVKMGKSTVRSALATHLIHEHGMKVFMAAPEESNQHTYRLMCGQVAGRLFHDPDVEFDYEAYDAASNVIGDNLYLLNLYQHLGWETLKADIMVAAQEGCQAIFIDPITNLTNGIDSSDANTVLQGVAQDLASMALDLNLIIWLFCHLKSPESGPPHERGGNVFSNQFAGSRAMMRSCHMMVGLEGNKNPQMPTEERNMRQLVILEDRQFGASGIVPIYYNEKTGKYAEVLSLGEGS